MAKVAFDVAVAFSPQDVEGNFPDGMTPGSNLDDVTTDLQGDRNPGGTDDDDGLILGDPESGIGESGLSLTLGRRLREKAVVGSSFTRPLSDFLALDAPTFSFAFPFCNHRANVQATPAAADFVPHLGLDAILRAAGMVGAATGTPGHEYTYGSDGYVNLMGSLVYYFGNRLELMDCRVATLAIDFTAGSIPIGTADVAVGSIKDPVLGDLPLSVQALPSTLDYAEQATVSAPVVESVAFGWGNTRGFQSATLTINNTIEDIGDSNQVNGIVKEITSRETLFEGTLFADDTSTAEVYELEQLFNDADGDFDSLTFTVGTAASGSGAAKAFKVTIPKPELVDVAPQKLGSKAGNTITLRASHDTADSELQIEFL